MYKGIGNFRLSMEEQRDLHNRTTVAVERTINDIVTDLIAGGQHPLQAQLVAPYIFHTKSED